MLVFGMNEDRKDVKMLLLVYDAIQLLHPDHPLRVTALLVVNAMYPLLP